MWKTRGVRFAALALLLPFRVFAHDAPNDVTVRAFLKPEGHQLNLLVRAPMAALQDLVLPERGRGYLDFDRAGPLLPAEVKVWLSDAIDIYEGSSLLPKPRVEKIRIALESDKSFVTYEQALAHFSAPELTNDTDVVWNQTFVDVWFVYPIQSDKAAFSINPALAKLGVRVLTVLRVL